MARKSRRRRNFVTIPFNASLTLGALADETVLSGAAFTLGEDAYLISADLAIAVSGHSVNEGPYEVGVAHGDLTDAEILEAFNAEVTDPDDIIAKERARRPVRRYGQFSGQLANESLGDHLPIRKKMKFSLGDGHTFDVWACNRSGSTFTSGIIIQFSGNLYARWQR